MQITIEGSLMSLNEYTNEQRRNKYAGGKAKKENTNLVLSQLPNDIIFTKPVDVYFEWHCKDKKKDPDNISFAQKFIFDAMVIKGMIKNDGWANIKSLHHTFVVDKEDKVILIIT